MPRDPDPLAPAFGDRVRFHDPESAQVRAAVVVRVHYPGLADSPVDLVIDRGHRWEVVPAVTPHPGQFGHYAHA